MLLGKLEVVKDPVLKKMTANPGDSQNQVRSKPLFKEGAENGITRVGFNYPSKRVKCPKMETFIKDIIENLIDKATKSTPTENGRKIGQPLKKKIQNGKMFNFLRNTLF